MATDVGGIQDVQCSHCACTDVGRGERRWVDFPLASDQRSRLLRNTGSSAAGGLLRLIRDATGTAIELSARGAEPRVSIHGTREQHHRAGSALRVAAAGGEPDAIRADLDQTRVEALGRLLDQQVLRTRAEALRVALQVR